MIERVLRERLLEAADVGAAAERAADIVNRINDELNEASDRREITVADSLVCRALLARGVLIMAADWWAELDPYPAPLYHKAIRSLVDDLPAELDDGMIDTRTGKEI